MWSWLEVNKPVESKQEYCRLTSQPHPSPGGETCLTEDLEGILRPFTNLKQTERDQADRLQHPLVTTGREKGR